MLARPAQNRRRRSRARPTPLRRARGRRFRSAQKGGVEADAAPPLLGGSESPTSEPLKSDGVVHDTPPRRLSGSVESGPNRRLLRGSVVSEPDTPAQLGRVASVAVAALSGWRVVFPPSPNARRDHSLLRRIIADFLISPIIAIFPPFSVSRVDFG